MRIDSHSGYDIEDSIVGVNLHPGVGELTEADFDRLAAAGVKWAARLPLDLDAHYDAELRRALLKHRFHLHGIFGVQKLMEGDELATGRQVGAVTAVPRGDKMELRDIPILGDPLLIAPRRPAQSMK